MAATMNAATSMGKNFIDNQNSIMNSTDLTLKKMFDITLKLSEQEEINNLDKIHWERNSWKELSLICDETVIDLQRAKVYVFSYSVLCLGRVHQHPKSNEAWKKRIEWITTDKSYRDYDGRNGEPTEFEWNIFPGFTTLQLCSLVQVLKRSGILWKRTVPKESGTISRTKCCWNSPKADARFSVQRLYCPWVYSRAKDTENCGFF